MQVPGLQLKSWHCKDKNPELGRSAPFMVGRGGGGGEFNQLRTATVSCSEVSCGAATSAEETKENVFLFTKRKKSHLL